MYSGYSPYEEQPTYRSEIVIADVRAVRANMVVRMSLMVASGGFAVCQRQKFRRDASNVIQMLLFMARESHSYAVKCATRGLGNCAFFPILRMSIFDAVLPNDNGIAKLLLSHRCLALPILGFW